MEREKLKVLIVEDSEVVTKRIRSMLKELPDVTVVGEAINGIETMAITGVMNPDVVLLDLQLSGTSGVDVLKEIKQKHPGTKVIILTNYSDLNHRKRCKEAGADYFFDKSIEFEKVPVGFEGTRFAQDVGLLVIRMIPEPTWPSYWISTVALACNLVQLSAAPD